MTSETVAFLLLIAAVVAIVTRRMRVPYSVGLVAAGIGLALLPISPDVSLTKELLFGGLLPPLIFEAAFYLNWKHLRKDLSVVLTLATVGVVLSAAVTAAGMHYLAHWQWPVAWIFGALIAATDPVSVIATFKDAGAHGRLLLLVEAESLFNDGTAAVAFGVAVEGALGRSPGVWEMGAHLAVTVAGSLLCGVVIAGAALLLSWRTEDHLVEITFTTVAAYGSFLVAEQLHWSGVLATLTAGLMMGTLGPPAVISARGKEAVQAFWEYAAFVANSLVFLLIGMREARQNFRAVWQTAALAIVVVIVARAVAVYPCCALFGWSRRPVSWAHQFVLFWGGLRGALALALALALPPEVAEREAIITMAFAVVAFSLFVQGLTMRSVLRRVGEIPSGHARS
jgi:Na+:H+ antiporter